MTNEILNFSNEKKELYPVGELPPVGYLPKKMYAWVLRESTLGNPASAFREETVDVPLPGKNEVIIANVAAGLNYNGVFAAKGTPLNVVKNHSCYGDDRTDFHICGSESAGIVYAVGRDVRNVKVGDKVIINCSCCDPDDPEVAAGVPSQFCSSARIWGYESNWGSFAQFSKVFDSQCIPFPEEFSWEEASCVLGTGATVYRMLFGWEGNRITSNSSVLVWGAAGGLGSCALKIIKAIGAKAAAVVSDDEKGRMCLEKGAAGFINRNDFSHWGSISGTNEAEYNRLLMSASRFRNRLYSIFGDNRLPDIVLEHPGSDTLPTSMLVCRPGGMVVLCGATSGYKASLDLRYLWIYQKRLQGSHSASREDCLNYLDFCLKHDIRPDVGEIFEWSELPEAHVKLMEGRSLYGQSVIRIVEATPQKTD